MESRQPDLPILRTLGRTLREIFAHKWIFLGSVAALAVAIGLVPPQGVGAIAMFYFLAASASLVWFEAVVFAAESREQNDREKISPKDAAWRRSQRMLRFNFWAAGFALAYFLVADVPQLIWFRGQGSRLAIVVEIVFLILAVRVLLVLPAAAAGEPISLQQAWDLSGPIWTKLCAVLVLTLILAGFTAIGVVFLLVLLLAAAATAIDIFIEPSTGIGASFMAMIMSIVGIFGSSCLGQAYKAVRGERPTSSAAVSTAP